MNCSTTFRRTAFSLLAYASLATAAVTAHAQAPDPNELPPYKPEVQVMGELRIGGSELKGDVEKLAEGFKKFHPGAIVSTNFMTSSEGCIGQLLNRLVEVATAGDDAKIFDQMPFFNAYHYVPTEISIATGGYVNRGTLWPMTIVVNKANPISKLSVDQIDRIFGSERSGGWEIGEKADNNLLFTAKYARPASTNIRTWGQLGLTGEWAKQEIKTHGYISPGFIISFQRMLLHWSTKMNPNFMEYVEAKEVTNDADGAKVTSDKMLENITADKYAIGFVAQMHVEGSCVNPDGSKCKAYPNVKILPISKTDGGPAIMPSADSVANRSYPLTRDAYVYVNKAPGQPLEARAREFLRFVLSREGQLIIAKSGIYSPVSASFAAEQLKKLD